MQKINLKVFSLLVLVITFGSITLFPKYQEYRYGLNNLTRLNYLDITKATTIDDLRRRIGRFTMPELFLIPLSNEWDESERERIQNSVEEKKYDLVILPPQDLHARFDLVSSLLSADLLANEIITNTGLTIAPAELVQRYMGERAWRYPDELVNKLAETVEAQVLHLYVQEYWDFTSTTQSNGVQHVNLIAAHADAQGNISAVQSYPLGSIDDEPYLENKIVNIISNVAEDFFTSDLNSSSSKDVLIKDNNWILPETLSELTLTNNSSLDNAAYFQLLALLTPEKLDFERRRLFERSLSALDKIDSSSSHYTLLKARALFHLYRRPLALELLNSEKNETNETRDSAELAFKDYMNGNYDSLKENLIEINDELLYALAFIELAELNIAYSKDEDLSSLIVQFDETWKAFLTAASFDHDKWFLLDNINFFASIKGLLPEFDNHFIEIMGDGSRTTKIIEDRFLSDFFEPALEDTSFHQSFTLNIDNGDFWQLYKNIAINNELREFDSLVNMKAAFNQASNFSEHLQENLEGHPRFAGLSADVLFNLALSENGADKIDLLKQSAALILPFLEGIGHVDDDYAYAERLYADLWKEQNNLQLPPAQGIKQLRYDDPVDFPSGIRFYEILGGTSALDYTHSNFYILVRAYTQNLMTSIEFEENLAERFNGHPDRNYYLAQLKYKDSGDLDDVIELLEEALESESSNWATYELLAKAYSDSGDYQQSFDTYLRFPDFQSPPADQRIAVSNRANDAANEFFWKGRYDLATPLFEISANQNTSSSAEMASSQRLGIIEQDFNRVIYYAYERGNRYNSSYGFRDLLAFLYITGSQDEAEEAFEELAPYYSDPHLWTSAFIGQRLQDFTHEEIVNWTSVYVNSKEDFMSRQGQRYLLMQAFVDRELTNNMLGTVGIINYDSLPLNKVRQFSILSKIFNPLVEQEQCPEDQQICNFLFTIPLDLSSEEYLGFLEAYLLLNEGKNEEAFTAFMNYDSYHDIYSRTTYVLPYFAMSLQEEMFGELRLELLAHLNAEEGARYNNAFFDGELAKAILLAQENQVSEAFDSLKLAFEKRPFTEWRPFFSWYEITDVAVWLSEYTGDSRFIDQALIWAKDYQVIQPQFAWAYSFEAKYSDDRSDRVMAAGIADYLDSNSRLLSEVSSEILEDGKIWFLENNPFYLE